MYLYSLKLFLCLLKQVVVIQVLTNLKFLRFVQTLFFKQILKLMVSPEGTTVFVFASEVGELVDHSVVVET